MGLDEIRDRIEQRRRARQGSPAADAGALPSADTRLGVGFRAGDRVFDTVSGLEGEVISGARENIVVPATE